MALQVKVPVSVAKPGDLGSILGTHVVGENGLLKAVL